MLLCLCLASTVGSAQQLATNEELYADNASNVDISAKTGGVWWGEIDGIDVDTAVEKYDLDVKIPFVELGYKLRHYEWRNSAKLVPTGDPWGDLHKLSFDLVDERILYEEQWGYFARAGVASNFQREMGNSFSYKGELGTLYQYDENLTILAGAYYQWYETDYWVIPTGSIRYRGNADEGLSIVVGLPESFVGYNFDNCVGLKLGWTYEKEVYRLGHRNEYNPRGFIETWDQIAFLETSYKIHDNAKLIGGVTYNFDRDFKKFDEGGGRDYKKNIEEAFGLTGSVCITF